MHQQPLDYQAPATASTVHWTRRPFYWLLFITPSIPLVVFLIPNAITLMPEPYDPWYTPFTAPIWVATVLYISPASALGKLIGAGPGSAGEIVIVLLYTGAIGWFLCSLVAGPRTEHPA